MNLSRIIAEKMEETILKMRGWINGRISIVVVRLYSQFIQGYFYSLTYGAGTWTGDRVQAWDWRNKLCARTVL